MKFSLSPDSETIIPLSLGTLSKLEASMTWNLATVLAAHLKWEYHMKVPSIVQVRLALQLLIPAVLAINHWLFNVGAETACLLTATWVYNDFKASDDGWIQRNFMAALAFWIYNLSSLKVAIGGGGSSTASVTTTGQIWVTVISAVIMTTMHVQDLKDMLGDKSRGRETAPLLLGEHVTRRVLAVPIVLWAPICALYWSEWTAALPATITGSYVALRCLLRSGKEEDKWTWQVWCFWTALLSLMPPEHQQSWLL
ncbi:hypothetical protein BCON_0024g00050 [Botryotinia convoluta]|uniref:UbiA prenyltransferase n=1 Tax=Botryotinia convoluta TaxID=54673 RepID=A0A4Z1IKF9_9HELO|nr:hypothetical protein BCON_0024g00050 [Botryotinia convoluta]